MTGGSDTVETRLVLVTEDRAVDSGFWKVDDSSVGLIIVVEMVLSSTGALLDSGRLEELVVGRGTVGSGIVEVCREGDDVVD